MKVVFLRDARFVVGGRKRRFDHKLRRGREEDAMSGSQLSTQSLEMSRLAERAGPRVPGDDYSGASASISTYQVRYAKKGRARTRTRTAFGER